jgi:hypothetical protein
MKNIIISAAKGSGPSIVKAMTIGQILFNPLTGYCHDSWEYSTTTAGDRITFTHEHRADKIRVNNSDVVIGIKLNRSNALQVVHRCVMVDFEYANDPQWVNNDWCWTPAFHDRIAGPDWPAYSKNILDYPEWCRNEMCQVAWEKVSPWICSYTEFDYEIDSTELFNEIAPVTLTNALTSIGCNLNQPFLRQWRIRNQYNWEQHKKLFSWQVPDA